MKFYKLKCFILALMPVVAAANGFPPQPALKWKFQSNAPIRGAVTTDDARVYFGNSEGTIFCLDKTNAEVVWTFESGSAVSSKPLIADGRLIFQTRGNEVYALDVRSGNLEWKFLMPKSAPHIWGWDYYDSSPVLDGKNVLIGSGDHKLYSLSLKSGEQQWVYVTGDKIRATPAIAGGKIYVPAFDGFLHILEAGSGKFSAKVDTEGIEHYGKVYGWDRTSLIGGPAISGQQLVIGSRDGGLYAFDLQTLQKKWRFSYGSSWVGSAPAIDGNTVFVGWSDAHVFTAFDLSSGEEKWKFNGHAYFYANPVVDTNSVYTGSFNGNIYAFDKETGDVNWAYQTGGAVLSSPTLDGTSLFVGSDNGYLYSFDTGTKVYKAVYHFEVETNVEMKTDERIAPFLQEKGYAMLDTTNLAVFMKDRIEDRAPSVVVFAHQYLPQEVGGNTAAESLLKRYMEAGGRVVWLGFFPNYWMVNREMRIVKTNPSYSENLLGIRFDVHMDFGTYFVKATGEGLKRGLPASFAALGSSIAPSKDIIPLAYNEFGRIASFYKAFGDRSGAGFILFRPWSLRPATDADLEAINTIAEFGL